MAKGDDIGVLARKPYGHEITRLTERALKQGILGSLGLRKDWADPLQPEGQSLQKNRDSEDPSVHLAAANGLGSATGVTDSSSRRRSPTMVRLSREVLKC